MNLKPFILFTALLALAASVSGCNRSAAPAAAATPARPPLRVATYFWPGIYWVDIAQAKGWFQEAGLEVVVVDTNPDYFGSFKDLIDGKLDFQGVTLFDVVLLNTQGRDLVVVAACDHSFGADGLAARPGLEKVSDLKGRRVGVSKGTYQEYILSVVLEREGLSLADVTLIDLPGEQALQQMAKGACDAVMTWEPFLSDTLTQTKGRKLFDTSRIPGLSPSVLTTRRQLWRDRSNEVQKLVSVWRRATEFFLQNPEEALPIAARAPYNKKTVEETRRMTQLDKVLDLHDNRTAFTYAAGFESLHGTARLMNDFLLKHQLATNRLDSTDYLDAQFLRALK